MQTVHDLTQPIVQMADRPMADKVNSKSLCQYLLNSDLTLKEGRAHSVG